MKERLVNIFNVRIRKNGIIAFGAVALIAIAGAALVVCNQAAGSEAPGLKDTITASSLDEAAELFSQAIVQKDIEYFEDDCETDITDQAIDSITLLETYHDLTDGTVYLYELHYRIKPENPDEVIMMGGMQMEDGWLTETDYGNFPLLLEQNGKYSLISNMNSQSFEGLEENRQYAVMWEIDHSGRFALSPNAGCDIVRDTLIAAIETYFEGSGYTPETNAQESRVYGFDWKSFTLEFTAELSVQDDGVFPQEPLVFRFYEIDLTYDLTALAEQVDVQSNYPASSVPYHERYVIKSSYQVADGAAENLLNLSDEEAVELQRRAEQGKNKELFVPIEAATMILSLKGGYFLDYDLSQSPLILEYCWEFQKAEIEMVQPVKTGMEGIWLVKNYELIEVPSGTNPHYFKR
jgi:hypothetical protein